ncbi:TlyA family RNA methyltransferase [Aureimonas fodinaquatilis]|uniref:TlyA family RNA methyltransferase n=1 Tax=Aureimonas fodinaquatilis TaxID=2565783 RepID=A0A5B0E3X0_9HYPH|nr:TlyA family RNA methyltransferase [Aureimonas fodinaquatilis]KAA0972470.1 TlyA family RNA methyltransferase [Aureimonas fodinaquatilis]
MSEGLRQRLDVLLAERGLCESRARARDAIMRGHVAVNGQPVAKPGQLVAHDADIAVSDPAGDYVSRAALKLEAALSGFQLSVTGRHALDVGASTGGFTQVLLNHGAAHCVAIDVGHGQMHPRIANDPRVTRIDGLNARELTRDHLALAPAEHRDINLLVSDVSFISLKLALPPALDLAAPGSVGIFLIKPQFEAGRSAIGKGGIVRDRSLGHEIAQSLADWLSDQPGWTSIGILPSPIEGGDGNLEFLLAGRKA